jgi:TPR repeat protein
MNAADPTHFGPFLVRGVLGQGGMGTVYLAWDPAGQREVAIKTLSSRGASENARRRFQREIRALARLDHPGLLPILDAGEDEGVPWFALPKVAGGSLEARLRAQGPLSLEETLDLGLQLCRALDVAHQAGILHRDLKPDNVLLERERYLLADFGLAKDLVNQASVNLSATGALQGTPGYWAPEQASGRGGESSVSTDVYGLGAVLYAALTGHPPIRGESLVELITGTMETPPEPPSGSGDSCPDLDALVLRCLAKSPADRFASLGELATELDRLQKLGREELLRRVEPGSARRRWGLAAAGVLVLGTLGAAWHLRPAPEEGTPTPSVEPARDGPTLFAAAEEALAAERLPEGLDLLRRAASEGHAPALHALGRRLESGRDLPADPKGALRCYRAAAEAGLHPAMIDLGRVLEAGLDEDSDSVEALEWYRKAAAAGLPEAKFCLAEALLAGEALAEDLKEAETLLREAAEGGEPRAMVGYAAILVRESPGQAGRKAAGFWYRKASEAGDPQAMVKLGNALTRGWGMEPDLREAARWYQRAAERETPEGLRAYALALAKGRGVTPDPAEAVRLLQRAAKGGYAPAMVSLGHALLRGQGVAKSEERALEWYRRAVAEESGEAMHAMAAYYLSRDREQAAEWVKRGASQGYAPSIVQHAGVLLQQGDRRGAIAWARRAAEAGDPPAMVLLAEVLLTTDRAESMLWYRRSAELGHTNAMVSLGYFLDRESPPKSRAAAEWYRKAAAGGATKGMLNLGYLYEGGRGVERDPKAAIQLYHRAAKGGDAEAMVRLARAYFHGKLVKKDLDEAVRWQKKAVTSGAIAREGWIDLAGLEYSRQRFEAAATYYRRAVDQGSTVAMYRLADLLGRGIGVQKDEAAARALLLRSVKGGHVPALVVAAEYLIRGKGGPADPAKGLQLLIRGAKARDPQAALNYATLLERGAGVPKDLVAALTWYRRAEKWTEGDPGLGRVRASARNGIQRLSR